MKTERGCSAPWVLLTNDDGPDSPALVPLLQELALVAPVRAVVPACERSWASKVMSRFNRLELRQIERDGVLIRTVDGYPADCANLGIHTLFPTRPALVVSGINIGANAGLAYFLSSGTVGAAIEGMLSGVPATAFSVQLSLQDYQRWQQRQDLAGLAPLWENVAVVTRQIVEEVLRGGLPQNACLLSVNMPPTTTPQTARRFTGVTSTGYGAFFVRSEPSGCFEYCFSGLQVEGEDGEGDIAALERGEVAITPVRFQLAVKPEEAERRRFERKAGKG